VKRTILRSNVIKNFYLRLPNKIEANLKQYLKSYCSYSWRCRQLFWTPPQKISSWMDFLIIWFTNSSSTSSFWLIALVSSLLCSSPIPSISKLRRILPLTPQNPVRHRSSSDPSWLVAKHSYQAVWFPTAFGCFRKQSKQENHS